MKKLSLLLLALYLSPASPYAQGAESADRYGNGTGPDEHIETVAVVSGSSVVETKTVSTEISELGGRACAHSEADVNELGGRKWSGTSSAEVNELGPRTGGNTQ